MCRSCHFYVILVAIRQAGETQPPEETVKWRQCENARRMTEEDSVLAGITAAHSLDTSVLKVCSER